MSQRAHATPFHRQVLLWIFILTFLIFAPVVIFYTSGYRWNPKKGKVDRNGTVIIDSTPTGANVFIDGRQTTYSTPITIQDMPPGFHSFQLTKSGYSSWEKTLEVKPERVTFANAVWLWKTSDPRLLVSSSSTVLSTRPRDNSLLSIQDTSPTVALISDLNGVPQSRFSFPRKLQGQFLAFWSLNGRGLLLHSDQPHETDWLIDTRSSHEPFELPPAIYRWEGNTLIGTDQTSALSIQLPEFILNHSTYPSGVNDQIAGAELRTPTGTTALAYVSLSNPKRGLVLPEGNWKFWSATDAYTLLRDGNSWLSIQPKDGTPQYHTAWGKTLSPSPARTVNASLLVNETELWLWNPLQDPELLYRQSEHIVNAVWESHAAAVFYATTKGVFAIDLDPRDGHIITPIAAFDDITGMTTDNKQLYITGTKDGQSGLWVLAVE